jgi:hypothetical protein
MSVFDLALATLYASPLGVSAVLTIDGADYPVTAVDQTAGVAVLHDGVETINPAAAVTASALADAGLDESQLDDATLRLNGSDWRVTSVRPVPSPSGLAAGEYLLFLEAA